MAVKAIGGYRERILRVDLSREQISDESLDKETLRKYIGGTGLRAKYLYEEVPPGVEWSDADNRIVLFSGPLGGTKIAGSGIFSVVSKGPMTNMAGASQANGFFGASLKFSGFDGVLIQGMANCVIHALPTWMSPMEKSGFTYLSYDPGHTPSGQSVSIKTDQGTGCPVTS